MTNALSLKPITMLKKTIKINRLPYILLFMAAFFVISSTFGQSEKELIKAIRKGRIDVVKDFINTGGDVNAWLKDYGCTALFYASRYKQHEIADLLLKKGAKPDISCKDKTALEMAITKGDIWMIRKLLWHGADPDFTAPGGKMPLAHAVESGNIAFVKELVEHGANLNVQNEYTLDMIGLAKQNGYKGIANYLENCRLNADSLRIMPDFYDGPHIVKMNEDSLWAFYLIHIRDGNKNYRKDSLLLMTGDSLSFSAFGPDSGMHYTIYRENLIPPTEICVDAPVLAIGDVHGKFDALIPILQNNGIIDENLNWSWGNGHLVFLGDVFDRGYKVSQVLWLAYKLERQARKAGGDVHFLIGNHEVMIMLGDYKYLNIRYRFLMNYFYMNYAGLYTDHTVIGDWIRSRNTVMRYNNILFSHAGISRPVIDQGLSLDSMNIKIRQFLNIYEDTVFSAHEQLLFLADGPLWFRGYARPTWNKKTVSQAHVDSVLTYYKADYQVIGHSPVSEITPLYQGKVIDIDVPFGRKHISDQAILIEKDKMYRVFSDKKKEFLMHYVRKKEPNP